MEWKLQTLNFVTPPKVRRYGTFPVKLESCSIVKNIDAGKGKTTLAGVVLVKSYAYHKRVSVRLQ
jgi:hypothetical protein